LKRKSDTNVRFFVRFFLRVRQMSESEGVRKMSESERVRQMSESDTKVRFFLKRVRPNNVETC